MKNRRFRSMASHLSQWIILLGTVIFIAVLSSNYFLSRFLLEDYVSDLARTTTSSTVRKIETVFQSVSSNVDAMASVISKTDPSEQQIHQILKAFLASNDAIFGMTVALEPNTLIPELGEFSPYYFKKKTGTAYSDLADASYQYMNWPWYRDAKQLNRPLWTEPYYDHGGGDVLMTTYSTQITGHDGAFAGIATADIELDWLDKLVKQIKIGESGFGFIVSNDDVVIAHPDHSKNMKKLDDMLGEDIIPENWQKYIESKTQSSSTYIYSPCRHIDGFCWIAVESLGNTGWKVIIVIPEQELISDINGLTLKISIIAVLGLCVLLLTVVMITRHFTDPLGQLALATHDIGKGNLDIKLPEAKRKDEIGGLTTDFGSMRDSLKSHIVQIKETTAKQQKLESEIQIAQDIQMSMIPGAGNTSITEDAYQLYAYLRPARSVGGDLYYYQQTDDMLHFIIGDVSDKGVPAALFMAKTVTLYTRALKEALSPGQTFTMMNEILAQNNDACMFVTALCGKLDLSTGTVTMANAGHMDPIIHTGSVTREEKIDGATALGLMDGVEYPDIEFQLSQGYSVVMYTDGISEAHDTEQQQYGDDTLITLVSELTFDSVSGAGDKIIEAVDSFASGTEQFDDITLFILRYE